MTGDDVDQVAVERACKGDKSIHLNPEEVTAAIALCSRRGLTDREAAELLGVTDRTVIRVRSGDTTRPHPRRGATVDNTREKISAALHSDSPAIRRAAAKANQAVSALDTLLAEWDTQQAARERIAELETALREAKAALQKKKPATATAPGEHKLARAWARQQGIAVPDIGRVPADVLEQWRVAAA